MENTIQCSITPLAYKHKSLQSSTESVIPFGILHGYHSTIVLILYQILYSLCSFSFVSNNLFQS